MKVGDVEALHCHCCARSTAHRIAACDCDSWTEQNAAGVVIDFEVRHYMLVCKECHAAQLRSLRGAQQLSDEFTEHYFPPHPVRILPSWLDELPPHIAGLLRETHKALANKQYWLIGMGTRTLIDMFALEKIGDKGGFEGKLKRLEDEKFLSHTDVLTVTAAVRVGNKATHRNKKPTLPDCMSVMDIVENLLQRLINDSKAEILQENRSQ